MCKYRCMKFLCIISGCPAGARKWHILILLCFCIAKIKGKRGGRQASFLCYSNSEKQEENCACA